MDSHRISPSRAWSEGPFMTLCCCNALEWLGCMISGRYSTVCKGREGSESACRAEASPAERTHNTWSMGYCAAQCGAFRSHVCLPQGSIYLYIFYFLWNNSFKLIWTVSRLMASYNVDVTSIFLYFQHTLSPVLQQDSLTYFYAVRPLKGCPVYCIMFL